MSLFDHVLIEPLGESAYILRDLGDVPAYVLAEALSKQSAILEATSSYETVGLYVEPGFGQDALRQILGELRLADPGAPKAHEIPVCYGMGDDLAEAAEKLSITPEQLVALHSGAEYRCYAVGFSPGFAFLGYLPEALSRLPRRDSPRIKVPVGAVGITGRQTGVYPSESPGGWNLIGRTPLCLVDVADAYFPISAGDIVRFVAIGEDDFANRRGERL